MLSTCQKCKVIAFGNQNYRQTYNLGEVVKDWADTTTYLDVIMQSNLRFDQYMAVKKDKALKTLGDTFLNKLHKKDGYWLTLACVAQHGSMLTLCGTQH